MLLAEPRLQCERDTSPVAIVTLAAPPAVLDEREIDKCHRWTLLWTLRHYEALEKLDLPGIREMPWCQKRHRKSPLTS